ncbi:MAG TPA: hypothetical protein VGG53_19285 [Mycobacterium sp.]|jgi:hypothetical protein|uniref:hypothetical protein n=1 Tax=Mycobacterium sp. TaxID=1785 RepID=UPI002F429157
MKSRAQRDALSANNVENNLGRLLERSPSHRRRFMSGKLHAESVRILTENVTLQDRALSKELQRKYIEAVGGGADARQNGYLSLRAMVTEPKRLAEILVERCRRYA